MICITSKPEENLEISGTGSSSQLECSAYTLSTNMNSDNLVNFQQRFSHFNPEIQTPHLFNTNSVCGQSVNGDKNLCDQNHNAVRNYKNEPSHDLAHHSTSRDLSCNGPYPELIPDCSCNIQIHYNIRYSQCPCSRNITGFSSDF